jgi:ergothioneine biosynthesis protein EgtB
MLDRDAVLARYAEVRRRTMTLAAPLGPEDAQIQSMPDASPTKWHLAHTTWFFETFVLARHAHGYDSVSPEYTFLFNSYYDTVGAHHARAARGMVTRPTLDEVFTYRRRVDDAVLDLAGRIDAARWGEVANLLILGTHHEEQHEELVLTDAKHALWSSPRRPIYRRARATPAATLQPLRWIARDEGLAWIGHDGDGFAFDNETPRHRAHLEAFEIASRLVTNAEYHEFIDDGGYRRPELWLSDGFAAVQHEGWRAPLYWEAKDGIPHQFTLSGLVPLDPAAPVKHVSYYEADAYARWAHARLPTEQEWEVTAAATRLEGNFLDSGHLSPQAADGSNTGVQQLFGDTWEWTASPYVAYPRYHPWTGSLGEYNGKFMVNQMVLRGGSCLTPRSHMRASYRNFFPPATRWQMSGIRLARWVG